MNRKERNLLIIGSFCLATMLLVVLLMIVTLKRNQPVEGIPVTEELLQERMKAEAEEEDELILYEGKYYRYNRDIKNYLFLGIDRTGKVELKNTAGLSGQADTILVLITNEKTKTWKILQISRDSIVSVDVYDLAGEYLSSVRAQISIQYAYGNGGKRSCWLMEEKVSDLLYDLPIKGYFSMNLSAIPVMNDVVGKVKIQIPEDYTYINPRFIKGTTVRLSGKEAEQYVRYRDTNEWGSNNERMVRQMQYISAFLKQGKEKYQNGTIDISQILRQLDPYLVTDMTAEQMEELLSYTYLENESVKVPGESIAGETYDEYYVDDKALYKLLIDLFYEEVGTRTETSAESADDL